MESREVHLVRRPSGLPDDDCFELKTVQLPDLRKGQALVKNLWMSVDPYMRGRMDEAESYISPFELEAVMEGDAVGRVVTSKSEIFSEGDYVASMRGWREYFIIDDSHQGDELQRLDPDLVPIQTYLGVAGMPGMTAYTGLNFVADMKGDETVFVSGAAGAVGSVACQIAKIAGCRVIGSAGSEQKVGWLMESAGVDAAFNYKTVPSVAAALNENAPEGIDIYFENVGGEHLTATISHMNPHGRIALCGLIAEYNLPTGMDEGDVFMGILDKSLRVQGFIVSDYYEHYPEFLDAMAGWMAEGKVRYEETIFEGIESATEAFLGLFSGKNIGKMLVKISGDWGELDNR